MQKIVLIEERHILAARFGKAPVARRRHAPVLGLSHEPEARVPGGEFLDDRARPVLAKVVHANALEIGTSLRAHRLQSRAQMLFAVVYGQDDRDHKSCLMYLPAAFNCR